MYGEVIINAMSIVIDVAITMLGIFSKIVDKCVRLHQLLIYEMNVLAKS